MGARGISWLAGLALLSGAAEVRAADGMAFAPCELRAPRAAGAVRAECATLEVPEDHDAPDGRRIAVRVARVRSRAEQPAPDPVVMLAGGPGQSALEAYPLAQVAFRRLLRRRDIVLVEQRGTGGSSPLTCALPDWKTPGADDAAAARRQARDCLARYEGKVDVRRYTTSDYIRDLEAARRKLGVAQFNLAGGSYGTRVALEYLRRHPDAVRSVFLDSVVPPELALGQEHAPNLDAALDAMAQRCAGDRQCRERFGDVAVNLRELQRQVRRAPRTVSFRHPRTHAPMTAPFGEEVLLGVLRMFLYAPQSTALLPLLTAEAAAGRPQPLMAQAELLFSSLGNELAHGMELSVICAEDADLLQLREADPESLVGTSFVEFIQAQCAVWPRGTRPADFKQPVVSDKPVLLLSGEYDPVTPPRYAEQVARTLSNGRHLVARGQGHTPLGVGCMPRLLEAFVETLAPKALDASCLDALGETPFFLDYQGPSP